MIDVPEHLGIKLSPEELNMRASTPDLFDRIELANNLLRATVMASSDIDDLEKANALISVLSTIEDVLIGVKEMISTIFASKEQEPSSPSSPQMNMG